MNGNTVITIGRQFGSGGRQVGKKLADKLGIAFYDKELIEIAAMESGMSKKLLESADEKPTNSFLYSLSILGNGFSPMADMPINDKLFFIQSNVIKRVAQEGSCVIVGRCADYILRNQRNVMNVFLYASREFRRERAVHEYGQDPAKVEDFMLKTDKQRASYYNFYTSAKWGVPENYDLCLCTSSVGIDGTVEIILNAAGYKK